MDSPQGTPVILKCRIPELEIEEGSSVSEQDIDMFENIFKEFLEAEHKRLLMPPLFILDVSKKLGSAEARREIKIVPLDDVTVALTGHPLILLTSYSSGIHGVAHIRQLSHLEVMRRYVDAELAIYALMSVLKTSISQGLESLVRSGIGKSKGLSVESVEFRDLLFNMKESIPYLPFKIDRDRLILLESVSLLDQLLALEKPGVKKLRDNVKESIRNNINTRIVKILTADPEKSLYWESMELASSLSEILPESYLNVMLYASYFTDLGAQGLLSLASKIAKQENKVKVLAIVEKEAKGGGNRLELVFEYNIFDYEDLVRHKENLLRIIDDALEICRKGRPSDRMRYIRNKIDSAKAPSELQMLCDNFSQTIFSQSLAPNQPPTYYIHANGFSYNKEDVMLFSSFFADLTITLNVLNTMLDSLESGGNLKKAIESAIRCPFRRAPQMKCVWKPECDHERVWFDAIYGP
ncbi:MAG: hypothetical protein QXN75_01780 [Thermoproteota archaeon]|nr:hypothetical protein [Candidatus Brockarchaeota archaeon]